YGLLAAGLLVVFAGALTWLLPSSATVAPFELFLLAILVSSCWGGPMLGLIALLLSIGAFGVMLLTSTGTPYQIHSPFLLAFLVLTGLTIVLVAGRLHVAASKRREIAKEALRRKILIDGSKDGMIVLDENGKIFEANQAFADMLGYTLEEIHRTHVWDWDVDRPRELVEAKMPAYQPVGESFEVRHRRKDGTLVPVEITATSAMWEGRKLMYCVCRDISARKRAEAELRERDELYRAIVDTARDGIVLIDSQTLRFEEFNDAACTGLGYTREEFVQLRLTDIGGGRLTAADILARMRASLESGGMTFDVKHRTKTGESRDRRVSNRRVELRGREYLASIWHDITEKSVAERALQESERRLRYVLAATGEGVWDWDLTTGRVTHNVQWCRLLELDEGYLQHHPQDYEERIHPADRANVSRRLHECLQGRSSYRSEHRIRRSEGDYIWVLDRGDVVERTVEGEPLRMVGSR